MKAYSSLSPYTLTEILNLVEEKKYKICGYPEQKNYLTDDHLALAIYFLINDLPLLKPYSINYDANPKNFSPIILVEQTNILVSLIQFLNNKKAIKSAAKDLIAPYCTCGKNETEIIYDSLTSYYQKKISNSKIYFYTFILHTEEKNKYPLESFISSYF